MSVFNNQVALSFNLHMDYSTISIVLLHVQQEMLALAYTFPWHTSRKTGLVYYPGAPRPMYSVWFVLFSGLVQWYLSQANILVTFGLMSFL